MRREGEKERERDFASVPSLGEWPQCLGLGGSLSKWMYTNRARSRQRP